MSNGLPASPAARPASRDDLPAIADTLADAFADYAWTRWALPADGHAARLRAMQYYYADRIGLPYGRVWVASDGGAVSVWTAPGTEPPADLFTAPELTALYGDRMAAVAEADSALAPHRPRRPTWFLAAVGVRRDLQGRGLGRAVIDPGLRAADADGVPAFLETATEANVAIYERLGFTVTAEVALPGGAPLTWCMERPPPPP